MDQIQWGANLPRPRPNIFYLCEDTPDAICDQLDNLRSWPALKGWDLSQNTPIAVAAARCQGWLFFGLLRVLTSMNGGQFNINDFITILGHRKVVNSAGVQSLLQQVSKKTFSVDRTKEEDAQTRKGRLLFDELKALLPDAVMWMIRVVQKHEESNPGCNLWNFDTYNVFLSVLLLLEGVCDVAINRYTAHTVDASCHCRPWVQIFAYSTRTLQESFKHMGHCVSLFKRVNFSLATACQALAFPPEADFNHSNCDKESCKSYNVNHETYVPRHTNDCDRCPLLRIDTDALCHLINKNAIPLIRSTLTSTDEVIIDVIDGTEIPDFAAISHLWAGGLGNMKENAHYHCQLKQIHVDLAKLHQSKLPYARGTDTVYYWLDSLCIPVSNYTLKIQAINSMAQIYAGSKTVLVIDPYLCGRYTVDASLQELDIAVLCSPWMARSWTLQEGALAVNIVFRFADKLVSFEQLQFVGGRTRQTSVQSLWSRDVDRIMPRAYHELAFGAFQSFPYIVDRGANRISDTMIRRLNRAEGGLTDRVRFILVWNELSARTTSESADVSGILGVLLDRSASEVLNLGEHARMQALIRAQTVLPAGLLFAPVDPKSPTWSPLPPMGGQQSHPLRFTDDDMELLPSGIFRIACLESVQALRSRLPLSLPKEGFIYVPASTSYCYIKKDDCSFEADDMSKHDIVLLFEKLSRSSARYSNGKCFALTKATENGLHLSYMGSFTYEFLGRNKARQHASHLSQFNDLDFFEVNHVSSACPLYIDMLVDWPRLQWARSQFYPFTDSSRQVASWLHMFDFVFLAVASVTLTVTYGQFMWAVQTPGQFGTALMFILASFAFLAAHNYLSNIEYIYFWKVTNRDLQQKWAASFSMQNDGSDLDSTSPPYTRMALFYIILLVATYIPTTIMFIQMGAVQEMWNNGFQWPLLMKLFHQFIFDPKPDGSQYPWYMFIARHTCRTIFGELLTRAVVIGTINLPEFFQISSTPPTSERRVVDLGMERHRTRFGAAKIFNRYIYVPGIFLFTVLAWISAFIQGAFSFRKSWSWTTLIGFGLLLHGSIIVVRMMYYEYGLTLPRLRQAVRNFRAIVIMQWERVVLRRDSHIVHEEAELISVGEDN